MLFGRSAYWRRVVQCIVHTQTLAKGPGNHYAARTTTSIMRQLMSVAHHMLQHHVSEWRDLAFTGIA